MLGQFSFYLVTDRALLEQKDLLQVIGEAVKHGVTAVQLREKNLPTRQFVDLARSLKKFLSKVNTPLLINDRIDVAKVVEADGVHIGQTDMHYRDARKILGENVLIGLTVEKIDQIYEAKEYKVDYLGLSSIFPTPTKPQAFHYWTPQKIMQAKEISGHPLVGIGGLNSSNARQALKWGLDGIAIVSAICGLETITKVRKETQKIRRIIEESHYGTL